MPSFTHDCAWKIAASAVSMFVLLSSCAFTGTEMTALPARIDYVCTGNRILPVTRAPEMRMAAVIVNNQEIVLRRIDSAAQEKYGNSDVMLYLDGEKAMLERNGQVLFGPCISPVPLPTYYR